MRSLMPTETSKIHIVVNFSLYVDCAIIQKGFRDCTDCFANLDRLAYQLFS